MTNTFEKDGIIITWDPYDRNCLSLECGDKKFNCNTNMCYTISRAEKGDSVDTIIIEGTRFSNCMGIIFPPESVFFIPWREEDSHWSQSYQLREYTFKQMFDSIIKEVDNPQHSTLE